MILYRCTGHRPAAGNRVLLVARLFVLLTVMLWIGRPVAARAEAADSARLEQEINQRLAKLNVKPRHAELPWEKARDVREAIEQGKYATAQKISDAILNASALQNWGYHPFSDFIANVTDSENPAFAKGLDAWIAGSKKDAIPLLLRAEYYFEIAWSRRGSDFAQNVQSANLSAFVDYMKKALTDVNAAISLDEDNPYAFYLKLTILHGFGLSAEMRTAFEDAVSKYPNYYSLYAVYLATLDPRWGGSVGAMYAFVKRYTQYALAASPLRMLYLSLYDDLLGLAATDCNGYREQRDALHRCTAATMEKMTTPELRDGVRSALKLYDQVDKNQFNTKVLDLLSRLVGNDHGGIDSGKVLELAASSTHSDTQLVEKPGLHNDYIIDQEVAESWYLQGFYDNAVRKAQEALKDIEAASFPSEADKDVAVASVYGLIGNVYRARSQYLDAIAYEKAALALGGMTGEEHLICMSYYHLKDYQQAVRSCTKAMKDDLAFRFIAQHWRGAAYRDLGKTDAALRDLTAVAESQDINRTYAVTIISMIYFDRNDIRSALGVLNKYKFVFDPQINDKEGLAVSYNNRCYAYMKLGEPKKALNDCNASLQYGSIPDAIRKQQQLLTLIGPQPQPAPPNKHLRLGWLLLMVIALNGALLVYIGARRRRSPPVAHPAPPATGWRAAGERGYGWRFIDLAGLGVNTLRSYVATVLRVIVFPVVFVVLAFAGLYAAVAKHLLPRAGLPGAVIATGFATVVIMGLALAWSVARSHKRPWMSLISPDLALDPRRLAIGVGVEGALLALSVSAAYFLIGQGAPPAAGAALTLPAAAATMVLIPFQAASEEMLFRGYLTQALGRFVRSRIAIAAIVGILFAAAHFNAYGALTMPYTLILSLTYSLVSLRDERLELTIGAHAATNWFAVALGYAAGVSPTAGHVRWPMIGVLLLNGALFYGLTRLLVRRFCERQPAGAAAAAP